LPASWGAWSAADAKTSGERQTCEPERNGFNIHEPKTAGRSSANRKCLGERHPSLPVQHFQRTTAALLEFSLRSGEAYDVADFWISALDFGRVFPVRYDRELVRRSADQSKALFPLHAPGWSSPENPKEWE
jgi:hypothetical protein